MYMYVDVLWAQHGTTTEVVISKLSDKGIIQKIQHTKDENSKLGLIDSVHEI